MISKHWLWAAGGVLTLAVASKISGLLSLSNEMEIETSTEVYKVNLLGFELRTSVKIKNPTSSKVNISFPFVKIIYQQQGLVNGVKKITETTLTSSQVNNTTVLIGARKETILPSPIIIKGSWLTLGMSVPSAVKEFRKNGRVNLVVRIRSEVVSLGKEIIQDQPITIGNEGEQA